MKSTEAEQGRKVRLPQARRIRFVELSPWWRRYPHPAGLGTNGIRRARLVEPLADNLRMHTQEPPEDQPYLVPDGPPFRAGFSERAIMRCWQTKPDDVLIESALRQTKEQTKRMNALTRRNHSGQYPVEKRENGSGGRSLQGRRRRR